MGPSSLGVLGGPPLFAWRWTRPRLRQDCSGTSLLNPTVAYLFWKSSWRSCIIKRNRSRNTSELATFPWWNVWTIPVPCPGYCRLHVHRGTSVALLVGELRFGRSLLDVIGPPSSLLDDRLEDILEGYDEAPSRVMDKLSIDNVVRKAW
ncbi:uncharacterized protein LOC100278590 [Zea mays]|uniref:Uncharacterized protein n=1 Tax=Zea mays TaxID=4577 RepID=B6UB29_MAIZE|nr:uncharacterized protein LOC100278590 [Zea mays]ACG46562.1 hypothetical protein [Zea mays]|eukprot:NP_001145291.1 uncharacterized protein LOC100278590 [Zea mays]